MSYSIFVAADVYGNKTNFELSFHGRPTLSETLRMVEQVYSAESTVRRPEGVPNHPFAISKLKIFDDVMQKWVDLVADNQINEWCQIYAFQIESPWHRESQKEIPPAVKPPPSHLSTGLLKYSTLTNTGTANPTSWKSPLEARGAGGSARGLPSAVASQMVDLNASLEEKIRFVFNEFDRQGLRSIEIDHLVNEFHRFNIGFSSATIRDIFRKDTIGEAHARVSLNDFEVFARSFPITFDCLFLRSRLVHEDANVQLELQMEKEAVLAARDATTTAHQGVNESQRAVDEAQRSLQSIDTELQNRAMKLQDLTTAHQQMMREKEVAQRVRMEREAEQHTYRERERAARVAHTDLARDLDKVERRVNSAAQDVSAAEEKVRLAELALLEAQRQAELMRQNHMEMCSAAEMLRDREQEALSLIDNILADFPILEDGVRQAELNMASVVDRVREIELQLREVQRDTEEHTRKRELLERKLQTARDFEQRSVEAYTEAQRVVEERERRVQEHEAEIQEQAHQRDFIAQHERELIQQEWKLREQRDSLEERESRLKEDATSFLSQVRTQLGSHNSRLNTSQTHTVGGSGPSLVHTSAVNSYSPAGSSARW